MMGQFSPSTASVCLCTSPTAAVTSILLNRRGNQEEKSQQEEDVTSPHPVVRLNDIPTANLAARRLSRTVPPEPSAMATYQSSNTSTETLATNDERNVIEQTEEIVRNFMYQRYQNDLRSEEGEFAIATPRIPDIESFTENPFSNTSQVGRRLAQIGDQINSQYQCEFREMITQLQITPSTAYEAFAGVARRLFTKGINWGRISALLSFGYQVAISVGARVGDFFGIIIDRLVRFITTESIARWISEHGGWMNALNYELENSQGFKMVLVCAVVLVGVMYWMKSH